MKVIFVTGYWKSGTTLLQFLLAKDRNIQNIFPRNDINYDGTQFWKKYIPQYTSNNGHYIPKRIVEKMDTDTIRGWMNKFYDGSDYILLKRPQFVMNQDLIKHLWPHAYIIATKRDLLPNIYSMMRMVKLNNYDKDTIVGQYLPGWKKMRDMTMLERFVYQHCYVNNYLDKHNIYTVNYGELCDEPGYSLLKIGRYIGYDFDMVMPDITNCDNDYINGTTIRSRNDETSKGQIELANKETTFPPFTLDEINEIKEYYDKYKEIETI